MIIEFHDGDIDNEAQGTLYSTVGKKGTIEYTYQGEMWIQDIFGDPSPIVRAYATSYGDVLAVWARDLHGKISYVGKALFYDGEWQLPFLHGEATGIQVVRAGEDIRTIEDGAVWAAKQLQNPMVACAILTDEAGVLASWERGRDGLPTMVSRSPRPVPVRS